MSIMKTRRYRIEDQNKARADSLLSERKDDNLVELTRSILKRKKYMYIDINEQEGYRIMSECNSSDDDDEIQRIGKKYVVNLNDHSSKNYRGINYLYKIKQEVKKKSCALQMLNEQLKKSTQKIEKMNKNCFNHTIFNDFKKNYSLKESVQSQRDPLQISKQVGKTLNKILSKSHQKKYNLSINLKSINTQLSAKESGRQQKKQETSPKRLKMMLPQIKREHKTIAF